MKNDRAHIIERLDRIGVASLAPSELDEIRDHIKECDRCRRAFESAWAQAALVNSNSPQTFEVPPYFTQKVMARVKADETNPGFWLTWGALWKSAPELLSSIVLLVVLLAGASIMTSQGGGSSVSDEGDAGLFSTQFIFVEGVQESEVGYEEVLATLYESEALNGSR